MSWIKEGRRTVEAEIQSEKEETERRSQVTRENARLAYSTFGSKITDLVSQVETEGYEFHRPSEEDIENGICNWSIRMSNSMTWNLKKRTDPHLLSIGFISFLEWKPGLVNFHVSTSDGNSEIQSIIQEYGRWELVSISDASLSAVEKYVTTLLLKVMTMLIKKDLMTKRS